MAKSKKKNWDIWISCFKINIGVIIQVQLCKVPAILKLNIHRVCGFFFELA